MAAPPPSGDRMRRPPVYEIGNQGHYGACSTLSSNGGGADPEAYDGVWSNITQGLESPFRAVLATFWMASLRHIEDADHNYKEHQLPLARIKKVMKADPEVKMISAEAPILFAKGCDVFITELTMRAWIHAEENKRRTLQRTDISAALSKSDMFDFLIDIVPREEAGQGASKRSQAQGAAIPATTQTAMGHAPPPVQQPQHHPQPHEYQQYMPEHDYRQQQMYAQDPAYGHQAMAFDPNQGIYAGYGMPQQMYQPHPPQHHYRHHDGTEGGDAEGERDFDVN